MSTVKSVVEITHDEGYGYGLIERINLAFGGRDMRADRIVAELDLHRAIERSGFAVSPCRVCGELVVCIPDGLAMCRHCAEKASQ